MHRGRATAPDLAFANTTLAATASDWHVETTIGSDHVPIVFTLRGVTVPPCRRLAAGALTHSRPNGMQSASSLTSSAGWLECSRVIKPLPRSAICSRSGGMLHFVLHTHRHAVHDGRGATIALGQQRRFVASRPAVVGHSADTLMSELQLTGLHSLTSTHESRRRSLMRAGTNGPSSTPTHRSTRALPALAFGLRSSTGR